jgi:hypothetical protein
MWKLLAYRESCMKEDRLRERAAKAEAERDRAYDTRDSIERRLLCEVRDLREKLELVEKERNRLKEPLEGKP